MKKSLVLFITLSLSLLLAACSSVLNGSNKTALENAAKQAVFSEIDAAFAELAALETLELTDTSLTSQQEDEERTQIVVRREVTEKTRELISLEVTPPNGTAVMALSISGVAKVYQVTPGSGTEPILLDEKPIELSTEATFTLEQKDDGQWHITNVENGTMSQGSFAATVEDVAVDPDALIAGSDDNKAFVTLSQPDPDDVFFVTARGRNLHARGFLNDAGSDPDATADDNIHSGYVRVRDNGRSGNRLGWVDAFNYTKTADLTSDEAPQTLACVLVEVVAAGK